MHDVGEIERDRADVVARVTPRTPAPGTGVIATRSAAEVMELILQATALIFANGETTERTVAAAKEIGDAFGYRASSIPRWDQLALRIDGPDGVHHDVLAVEPAGIDMNKVLQGEEAIHALREHTAPVETSRSRLARIAALPPVAPGRFVLAAAIGAAALAVVYGAGHLATLGLAAFSGGMGALIRRELAKVSSNLFVQPFCAAFLAGVIGGMVQRFQLCPEVALVALCPCMLLVPGPHFLNGVIDLVRARVAIGASRIAFALLFIAAISTGLLLGLFTVGASIPVSLPSRSIALPLDVVAAGFAVSAYGSFYSMRWRHLAIPIVVGMVAHGLRWSALSLGASVEAAAFLACLFVGAIITPVANRLRLPYAALGFAAVVAFVPGVFLFRMTAGVVHLAQLGEQAPPTLVPLIAGDGATAILTLVAMGCGLIVPKLVVRR
jgi:uncharacterized membrane protein YjjP (DUF1212 family)